MVPSDLPGLAFARIPGLLTAAMLIAALLALGSCGGGTATQPEPSPPGLLTPADGAVLDNSCLSGSDAMVWEFDWSDVPGATAYELYVRQSTATAPAIDASDVTTSSYRREATGYVSPGKLDGWEWRVRAQVGGAYQDWSATRRFSVEPLDTDCR
jgi:hypothetical protein